MLMRCLSAVHAVLEAFRRPLQPAVDRWLANWKEDPQRQEADFIQDADYAMIQQEPLRARVLLKSTIIVVALFVMWTAVTTVDEITRGEGKVIPIGIAIHGDHAAGRFHHISLGYKLGIGADGDIKAVKQ